MTITDPPAPATSPQRAPAGTGPEPGRRPRRQMAARVTSGRLVPIATAVGVVVAAGVAFGRVFGFAVLFGPLIMATVVGLTGGLVARRALTDPASGGLSGPGGGFAGSRDDPGPSTEPGPAWLAARPPPGSRPRLATARDIRRPVTAAVAVAVATLAAPIVVDALAARPAVGGVTTAITRGVGGIFGGWSKIVTTSVPVPPSADRLPVLAGVIALAVAIATIAASQARPGLSALLPAGAVLVVALALGVHGPGSAAAVSAAPTVAAGVYLLVVSRPSDAGLAWVPPARRAAGIVTGAVVVTGALFVGSNWPLATSRAPLDLRSTLNPPLDLGSTPNPLDLVPQRASTPGTEMFSATVDQAWLDSPAYWRLVSLDVFDGAAWTTDARARRVGTVLNVPAGIDSAQLGASTTAVVRVSGLSGPWVPTVGVPTGVHPADLAYDPDSAVLIARGSARNRTFTVSGRLPAPSRSALDRAGVTVSSANATLTRVPACFPAPLAQMATRAVSGRDRPDQQAAAIEGTLARSGAFSYDPAAIPGSSCGRLEQFVTAKQGGDEQFATAFVLMARVAGLPTRLAVGFSPGAVNQAGHRTIVHGSDATMWPEVDLAGVGWVRFNPVPTTSSTGSPKGGSTPPATINKADTGLNAVRGTVSDPTPSTTPNGRRGAGPGPGSSAHRGSSLVVWLLAGPGGLVVVVSALAAGRILARRRRRGRRRDPRRSPSQRIIGAWAEVLDAMAPFHPAVATLTPTEVTEQAGRAAGGGRTAVDELGVLVDHCVYGGVGGVGVGGVGVGGGGGGGGGVGDTPTRAWELSDAAVSALRHALPPGRRLRYLATGGPRASSGPRASAGTSGRPSGPRTPRRPDSG